MRQISSRTVWIAGIGAVIIISLSLAAWFFYIRSQQQTVEQLGAARGLGGAIPVFSDPTGSTYANLTGGSAGAVVAAANTNPDDPRPRTPRLWRLSTSPAAGVHAETFGTSTIISFVDRATGYVFRGDSQTGEVVRQTHTLIPNAYEALWVGSDRIVVRHMGETGTIENFSGIATVATSIDVQEDAPDSETLEGSYLDANILSIVSHPEGNDQIVYLRDDGNVVSLIRANGGNTNTNRVWQFPIKGWRLAWNTSGSVVLSQLASENVFGSAYTISLETRELSLIARERGLEVNLSPDGNNVLYSTSQQGRISLFLRTEEGVRGLPLNTLAQKCVWDPARDGIAYCAVPQNIPSEQYPDAWYRGEAHFSDVWWTVNTADDSVEILVSPESEYRVIVDVLSPSINKEGTHIAFLDAYTRTPWVLRVASQ
jgi:hypothetical protein